MNHFAQILSNDFEGNIWIYDPNLSVGTKWNTNTVTIRIQVTDSIPNNCKYNSKY